MEQRPLDDAWHDREIVLVPASKEKRFINFLVDYGAIIFLVICFYTFMELMGYSVNLEDDSIKDRFQGILFYVAYYIAVEGMTQGKSLGKILTKTRAVRQSGAPPEVADILKRSFCRVIPFEPFSFLGMVGWHDRWSDTVVVDEELSELPFEGHW